MKKTLLITICLCMLLAVLGTGYAQEPGENNIKDLNVFAVEGYEQDKVTDVGEEIKVYAVADNYENPVYQFFIRTPEDDDWDMPPAQEYSESNEFSFSDTDVEGRYYFVVWVKEAGTDGINTNERGGWDQFAWTPGYPYLIGDVEKVEGVTLEADIEEAEQWDEVTLTAEAAPEGVNAEYKFYVRTPDGEWDRDNPDRDWDEDNTFTYAFEEPGTYSFSVWSRAVGADIEEYDSFNWIESFEVTAPLPFISVDRHNDTISGSGFLPDKEITVTIDADDFSESVNSDENGSFELNLWQFGFDIEVGQTITVTDGTTVKTHTVTYIEVMGVSVENDTVSGSSDPDTQVEVHIYDEFGPAASRIVMSDENGNWTASFAEGDDAYDITKDTLGSAAVKDEEGDSSIDHWYVFNTSFIVSPRENRVTGWDWLRNAEITITIDDGNDGYTGTATTDNHKYFSYEPDDYDIVPGVEITVTDGNTVKTHIVTSLEIVEVDRNTGLVKGTAEADSIVELELSTPHPGGYGPPTIIANETVVVGQDGNWEVDFDFVIEDNVTITAMQTDEDGDATLAMDRVED